MMLLPCPWCGPRNVAEFGYLGETAARPDPNTAGPREWRSYLYEVANPRGWTVERWFHRAGCRKYVTLERHTATNEVATRGETRKGGNRQ